MHTYIEYSFALLYLFFWSVGFYIQLYILLRTKNSNGYSLDSQVLSIISMFGYSVYNVYFVIYEKRDFVSVCDLVTSTQIFVLSVLIFILTLRYPRTVNQFHPSVYLVIPILLLLSLLFYLTASKTEQVGQKSFILFFGVSNSILDSLQNIYQIALNHERKSCEGFAIEIITGEALASILMLVEQLIEITENGRANLNTPKIILAAGMLTTDAIIIYQRYVLYKTEPLDSNDIKQIQIE